LKEQRMTSGTVKFYNTAKGFGFIAPDDDSKDAFVHANAVERPGLPAWVMDRRFPTKAKMGGTAAQRPSTSNYPDR
jgi:cold shock CspA family protein